jgi:hypothetical protein
VASAISTSVKDSPRPISILEPRLVISVDGTYPPEDTGTVSCRQAAPYGT